MTSNTYFLFSINSTQLQRVIWNFRSKISFKTPLTSWCRDLRFHSYLAKQIDRLMKWINYFVKILKNISEKKTSTFLGIRFLKLLKKNWIGLQKKWILNSNWGAVGASCWMYLACRRWMYRDDGDGTCIIWQSIEFYECIEMMGMHVHKYLKMYRKECIEMMENASL